MDVIRIRGTFAFETGITLLENFVEKDKLVDFDGKILPADSSEGMKYKVLAKFETSIPILERILRIFLGVILAGITCGGALISETVRSLFKKASPTLVITEDLSVPYIYTTLDAAGIKTVPYASLTGKRIGEKEAIVARPAPIGSSTGQTNSAEPAIVPSAVTAVPPAVTEGQTIKPPGIKAILYTSMAGNPVHKGHMAMIATAIEGLKLRNIIVEEVSVSLSFESYLVNKVANENQKIKQANLKNGTKTPVKVLLARDARVRFLEAAIKESSKMFAGVKVGYWDDQVGKEFDHPEAYELLEEMEMFTPQPSRRIYFVAGTDLCNNMGNWGGKTGKIAHAVIITRQNERPKIEEESTPEYSRIILEGSAEFQDYSSTAIQQHRKFHLLPESVRAEFAQLHAAAQVG